MKMRINHNLQCEVDGRRDDCNREAGHCHITRNGRRVAQVWLSPVCSLSRPLRFSRKTSGRQKLSPLRTTPTRWPENTNTTASMAPNKTC